MNTEINLVAAQLVAFGFENQQEITAVINHFQHHENPQSVNYNDVIDFIFRRREAPQKNHKNNNNDEVESEMDFEDEQSEYEYEDEDESENKDEIYTTEQPQDFMWNCHKCQTWYFNSENDICINCVPLHKLPASIIKPGHFTYRPGYKSDIVAFGFIRKLNGRDSRRGIKVIGAICHSYLCGQIYDQWDYKRERFDDYGKDMAINHLNNRVQYRANMERVSKWRTVFGVKRLDVSMCVVYKFCVVNDIKNMMMGLIPSEDATFGNTIGSLDDVCMIKGMNHQFGAVENDEITMKADLKKATITFLINDCEIKQSKFERDQLDKVGCFQIAVSLCKQYDAIEMVECVMLNDLI